MGAPRCATITIRGGGQEAYSYQCTKLNNVGMMCNNGQGNPPISCCTGDDCNNPNPPTAKPAKGDASLTTKPAKGDASGASNAAAPVALAITTTAAAYVL